MELTTKNVKCILKRVQKKLAKLEYNPPKSLKYRKKCDSCGEPIGRNWIYFFSKIGHLLPGYYHRKCALKGI